MKRLLSVVGGTVLLMLLPLGAGAAGPFADAAGSGERPATPGFIERRVSFSAQDGPNGPTGHFRALASGEFAGFIDSSGPVTCLLIDGNRAVVGAVLEKAAIEERVGWGVAFAVEDNGDPADSTPDRLSVTFLFPSGTPDCTIGAVAYPTLTPITSGNFTVYGGS